MGADQQLLSSYERIAVLAERELELVHSGELDALAALQSERVALTDSLPATPPASARPHLERAARTQAEVTATLAQRMRGIKHELGRIDSGRSAVRRYGAPAAGSKRVDHAA